MNTHVPSERGLPHLPEWAAYVVGIGLSFVALAVRCVVAPALGPVQPYAAFYLSVALTAWWVGTGPAVLAAALGLLFGTFFFLAPQNSMESVLTPAGIIPMLIYSTVCACFIVLVRYARQAESAALQNAARSTSAESALRESDRGFEQAFARAPIGMAVTDLDGTLLQVNQAFCEITGYTAAELLNRPRNFHELTHSDDKTPSREIHDRLVAEEIPALFIEKRLVRKDGDVVWIRASASLRRHADGRPFQIVGLVENITERIRTEQSLRESEQRFRAVADNIPQLAWMTGPKGEILWFNRRWLDYTGKDLAEMQRVGWAAVHHPDHSAKTVEGWKQTLRTGEPWEDTFPLRGRNGEYRWFLSRAFPIRGMDGKIDRWFGTNTDITALKESERALAEAKNELARHAERLEQMVAERTARLTETVAELEAFSYSLSHDMRAPLRAMKGFSQILESDYADRIGDEGRTYLGKISRAAGRLDQLIRDVLTYSRIIREKIHLKPTEVGRLVHQLIDENPALQQPATLITVDAPHPVLGHEAYLMQVLSNLVYNAVKFVEPGQRPEVKIWTEVNGTFVLVYVKDNGIGIPKTAQERMFGMFQRLHSDQKYEGTGIGLTIVRKAVERMGGSVSVESEPGKGSTFCVKLQHADAATPVQDGQHAAG